MSALLTIVLATGAAFFYMARVLGDEGLGRHVAHRARAGGAGHPRVGAVFEIEVLKIARLGHVIVMVLAIEMLMTFVVSTVIIGETYAPPRNRRNLDHRRGSYDPQLARIGAPRHCRGRAHRAFGTDDPDDGQDGASRACSG